MTTKDFEDAKKYLEEIGKWKEVYNFRMDGYEIVAIADMYKRKEKKDGSI